MTILADFGADFKQSPHDEVGEHPKLSRKVEAWDGQPKFVGDPLYEIVTFIDIIYIYISLVISFAFCCCHYSPCYEYHHYHHWHYPILLPYTLENHFPPCVTAMGIQELKADGKTFMAVAASFVKHLADPAPLKTANIQAPRSLTF